MNWTEIALGDALNIKHGFAFKSAYFEEEGSHFVLTPGNFHEKGGFRSRPGKDRAYVGDFPEGYILDEEDLILAMTEQGPGLLGSSALVPEGNRYLHNQRIGLVSDLDETVLHKVYLYHLFNTKGVRGQISGSASGTKVRHTSPERIYRVRVRIPEPACQARIASILSTYDALMETNWQRIALLRRAARELYREWFVRLRFPDYENARVIDGIPEGWERKVLGEVLSSLESGGRPKGGAREEGVPSIGAGNVNGIGEYDFTKEKYIPEEYFYAMRKGVIQSRDVVVYKDGANIGRSSYFGDGFPHEECAVNEHVFILRALPQVGQSFLYFWVAEDETRQRIANLIPFRSEVSMKGLVEV